MPDRVDIPPVPEPTVHRYSLLARWIQEEYDKDHAEGIVHGVRTDGAFCLRCALRPSREGNA